MRNANNHKSKKKVTAYLIMPLLIAVLIYVFVGAIIALSFGKMLPVVGMLFGKSEYSSQSDEYTAGTKEEGKLSTKQLSYPKEGQLYAKIKLPETSKSENVYYSDSEKSLKKGAGQFTGTLIPGYGSPILIAGHNNAYFNKLKDVKKGEKITITTEYGVYTYKITETAIRDYEDKTAYNLLQDKEQLILYTCYPFDALGLTRNRFYVYADYISGPLITDD